jgi:hypothetical protein
MPRVNIVLPSERSHVDFPSLPGVTAEGAIVTAGVVMGEERSLHLWTHDLAPGAALNWSAPPVDHAVFVQKGEVIVDGRTVGPEGAVIVEHGGAATMTAGASGATLAHFHSRAADPTALRRAGGHTHVLGAEGAYSRSMRGGRSSIVMFADSTCDTCQLWLHRSNMPAALDVQSHYHTEDEIILIVSGAIHLGSRVLEPGTALAIDADTTYAFKTGPDGLSFINYRATDPSIAIVLRGQTVLEPTSEREILTGTAPPEIMARVTALMNAR